MLNSTLKASYICGFLTANLKLQYTGPESVLKCLDNGREWAQAININVNGMVANLILRHERWCDGGDGASLQG